MEKNENLQDKSEIENESTDKENQENLHQHTGKNLNEDEGEKEEVSPEDKINDLEDKLKRTFAEMENQRRRFEKEKDDAYNYGGFNFAKEALNLLDNLERSKTSLENDSTLKNSEILKKTIDHLNIIYNDMISIFKKNEIEEINSIDQKLDPNIHQAMLEIEDRNKEPGTVVQEIQKGFMMKGRLLRPSLVAVSKKPSENDEKTENSIKDEENQPKNEEKK